MENYITQNGIKYELRCEQYYPMFDLGEQATYKIGKYEHLHIIDTQAHEQIDLHIAQIAIETLTDKSYQLRHR